MNEELKTIVENVNKMLDTNYNLMSFDSLSNMNLLQVLGDVLVKLGVIEKIDVTSNMNTAIVDILEALLTIKFTPSADVTPIAFREGIAMGKRNIIYPILTWIFSNKERVIKIKYLSNYMDKVVIPDELKTDHEMVNLYTQYEKLIDEFWKTYSEHNKVERQAAEAAELKKDIKKMETDTVKLKELVETQKEKVAAIPNNSTLMVLAKDYHDANSESKKLEEQMKQQQKAIDNIDLEIKHLKGELERKKSLYPSSEDPVKVIKEEVHINKILANNKLPEELNSLKGEREIYTTVSSEPDPTQSDIDKLATDIETINNEIKELQGKVATNASDDKLAPFRNQSKIIANKKNELAATVMDLKHEIEITETKIAEKRNTLQGILGGPAMYGTELKQYISNVRDRCNLYKELRAQEQAMRSELGVLNRTIEILQSLDPGLVKALENNTENVTQTADLNLPDDDLQTKSKALTKEIAKKRAEVLEKREKVLLTKKDIDVLMKDYKALQQEFEEATQPIRKKLETVETEIALLESTIKEQEEHYKTLQQQIEKNETILQSLSEDLENDVNESVNKPSQVELIKTKLNVQQEKNKRLKQELRIMEEMKESKQEQTEILRVVKLFLQCKLES